MAGAFLLHDQRLFSLLGSRICGSAIPAGSTPWRRLVADRDRRDGIRALSKTLEGLPGVDPAGSTTPYPIWRCARRNE